MKPNVTVHDDLPPAEAKLVDDGLGDYNERAAPLHEVRPLSAFARAPDGKVIGGAVGRTWGQCCELQQLFVEASHRRQGIGAALVRAFEARALERGCRIFYLETFSFQAPSLYRSLGYETKEETGGFAPGISKHFMKKALEPVRIATRADVPAIMRIRAAVRENRLVSRQIPAEEVIWTMEKLGRGWVAEEGGEVVGFAIGNAETGNIWALFIDPDHEGKGHGRRLNEAMVAWLWTRGLERIWLTTEAGTRAERFYGLAGWTRVGPAPHGEVLFEQVRR